jgi:hypothetical protein
MIPAACCAAAARVSAEIGAATGILDHPGKNGPASEEIAFAGCLQR